MATSPENHAALSEKLKSCDVRPTPQREVVLKVILEKRDHPTADEIFARVKGMMPSISLATVYNTLHQFTEVGLLREVAVEGAKTYFDTNTSNHYHFFCETSGKLMDIDTASIRIEGLPQAPDGMSISRVDVLVRLVDKRGS